MRTKLSIMAALVAVGALGAGIGIAQGASGSHGVAAPTHASAQVLFAVVNKTGHLNRGLGALSAGVDNHQTGEYHVYFKRGVRKCAYVATVGTTGFTGPAVQGEASVEGLHGHKTGVFVKTVDSTGNPSYLAFHLVVTCPKVR
jgi:hypothetical protein